MLLKCRMPLSDFVLDVDIAFESRVAAIFGPSGAGKTSLLEAVAGLRAVGSGEIEIGGRTLFSSARKINLPPRERAIGYVPQEPALFPHLSVRENILFGAGATVGRRSARTRSSRCSRSDRCSSARSTASREARRSASLSPARSCPGRASCC